MSKFEDQRQLRLKTGKTRVSLLSLSLSIVILQFPVLRVSVAKWTQLLVIHANQSVDRFRSNWQHFNQVDPSRNIHFRVPQKTPPLFQVSAWSIQKRNTHVLCAAK